MTQIVDELLNVNVTVNPDIQYVSGAAELSPETGFGFDGNASQMGVIGCGLIVLIVTLLVIAGTLFLARNKFKNLRFVLGSSFASLMCAISLLVPTFTLMTRSFGANSHVTNFDVSFVDSINTSIDTNLTLTDNAPYGYTVTAYVDTKDITDNNLYNNDKTGKIAATSTDVKSPDLLDNNSYAVRSYVDDEYISISADPDNPSLIYDTMQSALAGSSITMTYAVKLDETIAPGTYSGAIKYQIKAKDVYAIYYDVGDGMGGPSDQKYYANPSFDVEPIHEFAIDAIEPSREGYVFAGWSAAANSDYGAYMPGNNITLTKDESEITLHAAWVPETELSFGGIATMQEITPSICGGVATGSMGRLRDIRDGKIYYVTKLADGKCWMTQNLGLDLSTSKTLTADDTDLIPGTSWTPIHSTATANNLNTTTWKGDSDQYAPYSYNPGNELVVSSGTDVNDIVSSFGDAHYATGNYYNWNAAVASNDTSGNADADEQMSTSICPKGWRLPNMSSTTDSEVGLLLQAMAIVETSGSASYVEGGFTAIRMNPLYFVRAGIVTNQGGRPHRENVGRVGKSWSSTTKEALIEPDVLATSFNISFNKQQLYLGGNSGAKRNLGMSVRCVAE